MSVDVIVEVFNQFILSTIRSQSMKLTRLGILVRTLVVVVMTSMCTCIVVLVLIYVAKKL